jgi:hypothetical protein
MVAVIELERAATMKAEVIAGLVGVLLGGGISAVSSWITAGREAKLRRGDAREHRRKQQQADRAETARRVAGMLVGELRHCQNGLMSGLTNNDGKTFAAERSIADFEAGLAMEILVLPKDLEQQARQSADATRALVKAMVNTKRKYFEPIKNEGLDLEANKNLFILRLAELVGNDDDFKAASLAAEAALDSYLQEARMFCVVARAAAKG